MNTGAPVPTTIPCATLSVYPMLPNPAPPIGFIDTTTQQLVQPYPNATNNKYSNVGFKVTAKIRYELLRADFLNVRHHKNFSMTSP